MSHKIKKRHIYWDLKDRPSFGGNEHKAKLAGRPLANLDIYAFFELTSRKAVAEHKRLDIERHHLEKIGNHRLLKPEGCIKLDPEMLTLQEVRAKQDNSNNGFKEMGRLCVEKWEELATKVQSSRLRTGMRPWDAEKQSLIIKLTQSVPDVESTLKRLKLL